MTGRRKLAVWISVAGIAVAGWMVNYYFVHAIHKLTGILILLW